jgi:hypothetical protein
MILYILFPLLFRLAWQSKPGAGYMYPLGIDSRGQMVRRHLSSLVVWQVHKFSKFIHGTATLLPELVQAVPYWVDDESVRPSMLNSAPQPAQAM